MTKTYCSQDCWKEDWDSKHEQFCKKDPLDRKVKDDSMSRRQKEEENCEEYKTKLARHVPGAIKEELVKVAQSCQELEIKGKEDSRVKKVRAKGGKLLKSVKSGENVQGGNEEVPVLEVDSKVKSGFKMGKQNKEEHRDESQSLVAISGASKEGALKAAQSCGGSKSKKEKRVKKIRANGGKLSKLVETEERVQGREEGGLVQEVD